ncbi:beta-hydroxylase, aspartyl/asparaginyl family, partial [Necator americanus]
SDRTPRGVAIDGRHIASVLIVSPRRLVPIIIYRNENYSQRSRQHHREHSRWHQSKMATPSLRRGHLFVGKDQVYSFLVGAGAHPMAVALAPVPRIDYSVTKGGARTWAVLLVFLFLCSGLYTIFSSKELNGNDTSIQNEQQDEVGDDSETYSDISSKQRRSIKESQHSDIRDDSSEVEEADTDDEEIPIETPLEDQLFAGLRKKIERNIKRVKEFVKEHEDDNEDDEAEVKETQTFVKRGKRRKNKIADTDDDVQEPAKAGFFIFQLLLPFGSLKKLHAISSQPRKKKGKAEREKEIDAEEADTDDVDTDDVELHQREQSEHHDEPTPDEDHGDVDEKDDEHDEKEESEIEESHARKHRSHGFRHLLIDPVPERECRRKHCPPDYHAAPRKSLLKKKNKGLNIVSASNRQEHEGRSSLEDDEDDENDDEDEKLDSHPQIKHNEVVALNKPRGSGREAYKRQAITNRDDHKNRDSLDRADNLVEKHNYEAAFAIFDSILRARPDSPRAHFGKGRGFQLRGEFTSNDVDFAHAIHEYEEVLDNDETPSALFRQAASRLIELASFRGDFYRCLLTHRSLVDRFPEEIEHQTDVALTFIKMKRLQDAKKVLHDVNLPNPIIFIISVVLFSLFFRSSNMILTMRLRWRTTVIFSRLVKVAEDNVEQGVAFMKKGLRMGGDEITDAKFYYHLGQGLMILGRSSEAYSVFEHAATLGLFLSAQQRSMYNVEGLTGRAWWSSEQTGYGKYLKAVERQWVSIRAEAARVFQSAPNSWKEENPTITVDGRWIAFPLLENGHFNSENCKMVPQTCSILKEFRESSNASRSEMRFSALSSGAQILPHCGPTNSRLQAHLGLIVPSEARIRVGNEQRGWKTGKFIIFDDSFEHELQFDGASSSSLRLILLIDLWHPEVESQQRIAPEDD